MDESLNQLAAHTQAEADGHETADDAEVSRLSGDLLRDFYQTFRLAQGETAVQPPLFTFLANKHAQTESQLFIAAALNEASATVDTLMPPARHADTDEASRSQVETGFRAMWNEYEAALLGSEPYSDRPAELVLDDMLAKDLYYQVTVRPNRHGSDPHESIVREYIIGDKLTGSEQLLSVRDDLRTALLAPSDTADNGDSEWMRDKLHEVAEAWENNHPGMAFFERPGATAVAA